MDYEKTFMLKSIKPNRQNNYWYRRHHFGNGEVLTGKELFIVLFTSVIGGIFIFLVGRALDYMTR